MRLLAAVDVTEATVAEALVPWMGRLKATVDLAFASPSPAPGLASRLERQRDLLPESARGELHVLTGEPADAIAERIVRYDALVVGVTERAGLDRLFLGPVAERLVRQSVRPVLVVGGPSRRVDPPPDGYVRLVVPVDFSPGSTRLLAAAHRFLGDDVDLRLAHALPAPLEWMDDHAPHPDYGDLRERATARIRALVEDSPFDHARSHLPAGHGRNPGLDLVHLAREVDAHLIAVGTRGHGGLRRGTLGSVAERILRLARCPVLLVPV